MRRKLGMGWEVRNKCTEGKHGKNGDMDGDRPWGRHKCTKLRAAGALEPGK